MAFDRAAGIPGETAGRLYRGSIGTGRREHSEWQAEPSNEPRARITISSCEHPAVRSHNASLGKLTAGAYRNWTVLIPNPPGSLTGEAQGTSRMLDRTHSPPNPAFVRTSSRTSPIRKSSHSHGNKSIGSSATETEGRRVGGGGHLHLDALLLMTSKTIAIMQVFRQVLMK
jgi:hypothetical protein